MHDKEEKKYEITQSWDVLDGRLVQQGFVNRNKLADGDLLEMWEEKRNYVNDYVAGGGVW